MPRGAIKCQYCGIHCLSTDDLKAHLLSHTVVQPEISQKLLKGADIVEHKKTLDVSASQVCDMIDEIESSQQSIEIETSQFNNAKQEIKVISKTVERIQSENTVPHPHTGMSSEPNEESAQKGFCVGVVSEIKDPQSLGYKFKTDVVSISGGTKDSFNDHSPGPSSVVKNNSSICLPQKITNTPLPPMPPNTHSLKEDYISEKEPNTLVTNKEMRTASFHADNSSLNSEICDIPDSAHVTNSSDLIESGASHIYHLNLDDNCQVTIEKRHEGFDLNSCDFEDETYRNIPDTVKSSQSLQEQGLPIVYGSSSVVVMANTEEDVNY